MDKTQLQVVQETAAQLLSALGVTSPFEVKEAEEGVEVELETEENGILIGYHGETLEALQLLLALAVAKKLGSFIRVSVEVGQYKKNRMEYLQNVVREAKEKAVAEKTAVALPNLKSWERRYVHMLVQEDGEITSESSGEGRERVLTIYPKN